MREGFIRTAQSDELPCIYLCICHAKLKAPQCPQMKEGLGKVAVQGVFSSL